MAIVMVMVVVVDHVGLSIIIQPLPTLLPD
jgi:hypothetical protein